jgi:hypothetical protein
MWAGLGYYRRARFLLEVLSSHNSLLLLLLCENELAFDLNLNTINISYLSFGFLQNLVL